MTTVNMFASVQLNINKCEIVPFSHSNKSAHYGAVIPVRSVLDTGGEVIYLPLGLFKRTLGSSMEVSRAFQGDLNPLSTRSVIETCAIPVLLSDWILSNKYLESIAQRQL